MPPLPPETALADAALIRGIAAYRRHPWQRNVSDPPVLWSEGAARVLDYGRAGAPPLLIIPSLVNRSYILDLMPDRSFVRWFAAQGVRPLLLDWGWPEQAERQFTLTDFVAGTLERAMAAAASAGPLMLAGYCMGGLLALAAANRRPDLVRGLALLATPWDFHAEDADRARGIGKLERQLEPVFQATGTLPVDMLQSLFASVSPGSVAAKFRSFAAVDQGSPEAARFVALEDWLNDGVPLGAPVARETLGGWYGANTPGRGAWQIAGEAVRPERLRTPCFVAIPARDRIVPPTSAMALATAIPGATIHRPAAGHIGMVAGSRAEAELWGPMLAWFRAV